MFKCVLCKTTFNIFSDSSVMDMNCVLFLFFILMKIFAKQILHSNAFGSLPERQPTCQ